MTEKPRSAFGILEDLFVALCRGISRSQKRKLLAYLREVVKGTELVADPPPSKRIFFEMTARGTIDGITVVLTLAPPGVDMASATLLAAGLPLKIQLWAEEGLFWEESSMDECLGLFWRDRTAIRNSDIQTGSGTFDDMIEIRGHVALCLALLDEKTRDLVVKVVRNQNAVLRDRRLMMKMVGPAALEAASLTVWAAPFLELVRVLAARMRLGTKACLLDNIKREAGAPVRALNLAALGLAFPGEPETVEASRQAVSDRALWCRIYGAANLGLEGADLLMEVMRDIRNDSFQRATALYYLGQILPSVQAESLLLEHLDSLEWPVLLAAAQGLADGPGSVRAVPALFHLAETAPNREARAEARAAAERIQDRLEGAVAGRLSVAPAEGEEGRLSRPGDE